MDEIFFGTPAEYAVYGEGEITFSELIYYLKGRGTLDEINGLMYKKSNGQIITNPPRSYIQDLDTIPLPAYDLFPMDRYPLHRMVTSRGCPYSCAFCNSSSIWDNKWRKRSAADIVNEIEFLIRNYGKKIFVFSVNSFNIDMKNVEELCDLLISRKIRILWSTNVRADHITAELALKMKNAGCYNVAVGIESASNEILSRMGKKITVEKITEGIRIYKNAGIEVLGQFVIGSPYDTLATVRESIAWAKSAPLDYANFYSILPFKRTAQWDYVAEQGTFFTETIHDFHSIDPRIVFETPEFSYADRLEAIRLAKREGFYSNQDKKNWWFDFAKEFTRKMQNVLPESLSSRLYRILKSVYQIRVVKKNNPG
jgi:anaerobic magnesium-protoporphyrin IX monomethyl ester cyclase